MKKNVVCIEYFVTVLCILASCCGIIYLLSPDYLYVNLSTAEAQSLCGKRYSAGQYKLYLNKLRFQRPSPTLHCSIFKSKNVTDNINIVARAAFANRKYEILGDIYSLWFYNDLDKAGAYLSERISQKFSGINEEVVSSVNWSNKGIPVVRSDSGYQKIKSCQWNTLNSAYLNNQTLKLVNKKGYLFVNAAMINRYKIDRKEFASQLEENLTCIIKHVNLKNVTSWTTV